MNYLVDLIMLMVAGAFPVAVGWTFLGAFFPRACSSRVEKLGIAFGAGMGLVVVAELALLYFGVRFADSPWKLFLPLSLFAGYCWKRALGNGGVCPAPLLRIRLDVVSKTLLAVLVLESVWILCYALALPVSSDDGVVIWAMKAKIIYFSNIRHEPFSALAAAMHRSLAGNYPLFVPLAEHYMMLFFGQGNDVYTKLAFPLYYCAFLCVFYGVLQRVTNRRTAIVFTFFLGTMRFLVNSAVDGTADLVFAYYYSCGFLLMVQWAIRGSFSVLCVAGLFSAVAIFTKNEGMPSFLITCACVGIAAWRRRQARIWVHAGGFVAIGVAASVITAYYQHLTGIVERSTIDSGSFTFTRLVQNIGRLPYVLDQFQHQLLGTANQWNLMGPLFIVALFLGVRTAVRSWPGYLLLAIFLNFALYATVYVVSPLDVAYLVGCSQNRLLLHFIALPLFFSAVVLHAKKVVH